MTNQTSSSSTNISCSKYYWKKNRISEFFATKIDFKKILEYLSSITILIKGTGSHGHFLCGCRDY